MARTIKDIKKSMTDQFMADQVLREMYGLKEGDTFEGSFSAVCLESILFGIVAAAVYVLESIFEAYRKDVDSKIANSVVATIPWYHKICLGYQHGDELVLDETTFAYEYAQEDDSKKLVKYAACRDRGGGVYILAAGEGQDGYPQALTNDVLTAFKEYVRKRKPAGVITDIYTYDPDDIIINLTVQYDPMLVNPDGSLIRDESVFPVEEAVNGYLKNIIYGGTFNRTKLIDAVQTAEGVLDLTLGDVMVKPANSIGYTSVTGNNYASLGGSFKAEDLKKSIRYVLEI